MDSLFYFGALGSMTFFAFDKGVTRRQYWLWCSLPMAVDFVMEQMMLHYDLYYYYGNEPLLVGKLPLWWVPCNSLGQILAVAFIALVKPLQSGWKQLLIPLVIPFWDAVAYSAISIPCWICREQPDVGTPGAIRRIGHLRTSRADSRRVSVDFAGRLPLSGVGLESTKRTRAHSDQDPVIAERPTLQRLPGSLREAAF